VKTLSDPPRYSLLCSVLWWLLVLVDPDGPSQGRNQRDREMKRGGRKIILEGGGRVVLVVAAVLLSEDVARDLAAAAAKTDEGVSRRTDLARRLRRYRLHL
jgi:hypothetical protein